MFRPLTFSEPPTMRSPQVLTYRMLVERQGSGRPRWPGLIEVMWLGHWLLRLTVTTHSSEVVSKLSHDQYPAASSWKNEHGFIPFRPRFRKPAPLSAHGPGRSQQQPASLVSMALVGVANNSAISVGVSLVHEAFSFSGLSFSMMAFALCASLASLAAADKHDSHVPEVQAGLKTRSTAILPWLLSTNMTATCQKFKQA